MQLTVEIHLPCAEVRHGTALLVSYVDFIVIEHVSDKRRVRFVAGKRARVDARVTCVTNQLIVSSTRPHTQICRRSVSQGPHSTLVSIRDLGQKSLLFRSLLRYCPQRRTQDQRHDTSQSWPRFLLRSCPCPARHLGACSRICPLCPGFA